ncbi:MAG: nucleotidyltransferase domain-containing protein [Ignavibacteriaceae bacterium]
MNDTDKPKVVNQEIEKFIDAISKTLKQKYKDFKDISFYGSRVKENFREDSDYDLVFVIDGKIDWKFEREIRYLIYEAELNYDLFIDNKIYNIKDIETPNSPLRYDVKSEGVFYGV